MEKSIRKNMYLLANKKVHESLLFTNPYIKYVLMKNERKPQFIIGIYDDIDELDCVFEPNNDNDQVILEYLEYKHPIFSEETEACEEGYILSLISEGYEPVFIDIQTHVKLWDFIDYHMDTVDSEKETILCYLEFCLNAGINPDLLSEYSDISINNLYKLFIKDTYSILCYNKYGNFLSLDHDGNDYVLGLMDNSKKVQYTDFNSAFHDFLSIVLEDITSTHAIKEDLGETLRKLGEKEHE